MMARFACSLMTRGCGAIGSRNPLHALGSFKGRWRAFVMLAAAWLSPLTLFAGEPRPSEKPDARAWAVFDIPSQPLTDALQTFGDITGLAVLIDSRLLAGLESSAVSGRYRQGEALQLMLVGTGLAPRYVEDGAFTLVATGPLSAVAEPPPPVPATAASAAARARSARIIQRSLEQALCASALARPGRYRAGVRFWLDERGHILRPELSEPTGNDERDAEILRRLAGLPLHGLPRETPQPVMLLLLPESDTSTPPCLETR
jgi:hypothetical protein